MKKIIRLTESDLTRIIKRVIQEQKNTEIEEGFFDNIFGRPSIKDAAHTAKRGTGHSHTGKHDSSSQEHDYISFGGQKFSKDDVEYADYHDLGDLPRIEGGKLIIANPAWDL